VDVGISMVARMVWMWESVWWPVWCGCGNQYGGLYGVDVGISMVACMVWMWESVWWPVWCGCGNQYGGLYGADLLLVYLESNL
jgi:hypothetical protein